jgi:DNA-binding beta-propeller fold protein YncE
MVSTLAGDGGPGFRDGCNGAARFNYPSGIAVDRAGNIYVADQDNHRIRVVTTAGRVSTLARGGVANSQDGKGLYEGFNFPSGIAVNAAGQVYVADSYNNRVRMISPSGTIRECSGFKHPYGIAADAAGNVLVADTYNKRIRRISTTGFLFTLAGVAEFHSPTGVAIGSDGTIYIADAGNHRIWKLAY